MIYMSNNMRFTDKIAVVTGGASGIGKAIASRLGQEGATLALLDANAKLLETTTNEFIAQGIGATGYAVDISNEQELQSAIDAITARDKRIDVLVHAAGIVGPTSTKITEYSSADFDKVYQVNLKGSFLITKLVVTEMAKTGRGRILLLASIAGKDGNPGMVGYTATKAGVIGLVKGVAKEFATTGITINGLAPAVIRTAMNDNTSQQQLDYMIAKIPMQRLGTVEEVAAMSCFIVSDENSFSTGFVYDISGGRAVY